MSGNVFYLLSITKTNQYEGQSFIMILFLGSLGISVVAGASREATCPCNHGKSQRPYFCLYGGSIITGRKKEKHMCDIWVALKDAALEGMAIFTHFGLILAIRPKRSSDWPSKGSFLSE
jgi:hypothetical protein